MRYEKYCPICGIPFLAFRIGTIYCSKKCCNRAQKISPEMLDILIKGANSRCKPLETMPKIVREYLKKEQNLVEQTGNGNDLNNYGFKNRTDALTVLREVEAIKKQRDQEALEQQFKVEELMEKEKQSPLPRRKVNIQGIEIEVEIDPEMENFNLSGNNKQKQEITEEEVQQTKLPKLVVTTKGMVGDFDISGNVINTEEFPVVESPVIAKSNGIRRIGGKK